MTGSNPECIHIGCARGHKPVSVARSHHSLQVIVCIMPCYWVTMGFEIAVLKRRPKCPICIEQPDTSSAVRGRHDARRHLRSLSSVAGVQLPVAVLGMAFSQGIAIHAQGVYHSPSPISLAP